MIMSTKKLAYAAAVAVIYIVVTLAAAPISFGFIQVRVSEALTVLPALSPWTIWGLFTGCLISNIYTGQIVDIVFGSIATLLAACVTYFLRRRKWLLPLPPVILNGVIVGGYLTALYGGVWYVNMATVALGEFISCYVIGLPLLTVIRKNKQLTEFLK